MDFSNLINTRLTVLNEAENRSRYSIPDEEFDDQNSNDETEDTPTNNPNDVENDDNQANEEENNKYDLSDDIDEEEPSSEDQGDEQYQEQEDYDNNQDNNPEDEPVENSIPKLTILNLSEKDKKLNNLNLLKQFNELSKNISDNLNSNIINITTLNKKNNQIIDFVSDNLYKLVTEIQDYVLYKYDDVYEENVITYNAFLKRYHTALQLIRQIVDEQSESDNSNSK